MFANNKREKEVRFEGLARAPRGLDSPNRAAAGPACCVGWGLRLTASSPAPIGASEERNLLGSGSELVLFLFFSFLYFSPWWICIWFPLRCSLVLPPKSPRALAFLPSAASPPRPLLRLFFSFSFFLFIFTIWASGRSPGLLRGSARPAQGWDGAKRLSRAVFSSLRWPRPPWSHFCASKGLLFSFPAFLAHFSLARASGGPQPAFPAPQRPRLRQETPKSSSKKETAEAPAPGGVAAARASGVQTADGPQRLARGSFFAPLLLFGQFRRE